MAEWAYKQRGGAAGVAAAVNRGGLPLLSPFHIGISTIADILIYRHQQPAPQFSETITVNTILLLTVLRQMSGAQLGARRLLIGVTNIALPENGVPLPYDDKYTYPV